MYISSLSSLTRGPYFISSMGWFVRPSPTTSLTASSKLKDTLQPLRSEFEGRGKEFQLIKDKCGLGYLTGHLRRVGYFLWESERCFLLNNRWISFCTPDRHEFLEFGDISGCLFWTCVCNSKNKRI